MNPTLYSAVLFLALLSVANSQPFVKGGLLLLGAAKLGFIKGVLLANKFNKKDKKYYHGKRQFLSRGKRSVIVPSDDDAVEEYVLEAFMDDSDDCLKFFVCTASSMPAESKQKVEQMITAAFNEDIDPISESAEYQLASAVGRKGGAEQCQKIYTKCQADYDEITGQLEEAWKQEQILVQFEEEKD